MRKIKIDSVVFLTVFSLFGVFVISVSSAVLPFYATVAGSSFSRTMSNIKEHFSIFTGKEYLLFFDFFLIPFTISCLALVVALMILLNEKFRDRDYFLLIISISIILSIAYLYFSRSIIHLYLSISLLIVIFNFFGVKIIKRKGGK